MASQDKRAVILCHGDFSPGDFELSDRDVLICADGGAEYAANMGWWPDVIIGDLDSLPPAVRRKWEEAGAEFIVHPPEKDKTDGELALDYAVDLGVEEVVLLGALGGRIDHTLSNVFMLTETNVSRARIVDARQELWVIGTPTQITGQEGDTVSLIPLTSTVTGVHTEGLYYPLSDGVLRFGSSLGNSNKMTGEIASISIDCGKLLIVHSSKQG